MRILFYLPVVTPWWFESVIVPMLRSLHEGPGATELHVMIAPRWRNTGLDAEHLNCAADLTGVYWHVIDEGEPDQFRLDGASVPGLLDAVAGIAPDVTLARSADVDTLRLFPGTVRFIMEAAAPPIAGDPQWAVLNEEPFDQGALPADAASLAGDCARLLQPSWDLAEQFVATGPPAALRRLIGLPSDRTVLAVPLHYEHEENYFLSHAAFPSGEAMVEHLLAATDDDVVLAVSDHPLNRLYVDREAIDACLARHAGRVIDCTREGTPRLAIAADAMVVDLSKSWSLAAFHGQPVVNLGRRPIAPWLQAAPGVAALAVPLMAPNRADARRWFGWHFCTRVLNTGKLTLDRLERALQGIASEADIADNLAMVLDRQLRRAAQAAA